MKNLTTMFFATLLLMLLGIYSVAQQPKIQKFGKDIIDHLKMTSCEIDSSAHAVILFDEGESNIIFVKDKGRFCVEISRHTRIKILDKDGLDWANFSIPIYKSKTSKERLSNVRGTTYNLNNGKIEKVKLSRKSELVDEINERFSLVKFTMPQVREGSVIEFSYTILSEFTYNLQDWEFQSSIPTLISKYSVLIPEYYKYNHRMSGYENITVEKENSRESVTFVESSYHTGNADQGTARQGSTYQVHYDAERFIFYGYNIPKLRNEPYVDNINNYQTRIDFELQFTNFSWEGKKQYATNWASVTSELLDDFNFGREITGARFLKDDIQAIASKYSDQNEKMLAVFSHIQEKIKWNDRYRLKTEKGTKKAYNDGSGNSAEVNLCLIAALIEAGFDAFPIALSTRSSGMILPWEVSLSKLNHVIAGVAIGGDIVTLDATSSFSAPNILPLECLNGNARIIDKKRSEWIDLNPTKPSKSSMTVRMSISDNDEVTGTVSQNLYNHSALRLHRTLLGDDNYEKYRESLQKNYKNGAVDSISVSQTILPNPEIKVSYQVSIPESVIHAGDLIYLSPGVGSFRTSNPFVSPTRKLPINFNFPFVESIEFVYKIPEGYSVHEVPDNMVNKLQDGKGEYSYSITTNGEEVIVTTKLSINQTLFVPTDYSDLRTFYDKMVSKNSEKIVFKKI
jgi:hypothetical protein